GVRKTAEGALRKGAGTVLHRPGEPILAAGDLRQVAQRLEVDRHLLNGAVGKDDPAMGSAGLDRDLAETGQLSAGLAGELLQLLGVAVHIGPQLLRRGVLR